MVNVALTGEFVPLGAAAKFTVALPDPALPEVIVTHEGIPVTDHEQPTGAMTLTDPNPPKAEKAMLPVLSE